MLCAKKGNNNIPVSIEYIIKYLNQVEMKGNLLIR